MKGDKKVDPKKSDTKEDVFQQQGEKVVKLTPHPPTSPPPQPPRDPVMFLGLYFFQFKKRGTL